MEGGQTRGTGRAASSRWLHFAAWLRQQAGAPPEEAVSEASASDAEEALVPAEAPTADPAPASTQGGLASVAREEGVSGPAPPSPVSPGQLARHATLAPRLPDCRAEMRLTSDSSSRARQEMTVMLAAPGMPLHQAPVLTAKQASALMGAICEPLLSLPVGRLTRKLSAPTRLQPTGDRGMLSLWLLPDDSLSLVWQSAQQLPATAVEECAAGTRGGGSSSGSSSSSGGSSSSAASQGGSSSGGLAAAGLQQTCSLAMWEELAHFPAMSHLLDDAAVVTIHMLRGDASGRSFYIRVRGDVAEANLEAATAAVPDASRLLQQQLEQRLAGVDGAPPLAPEADGGGPPRMYFWLADGDLGRAVYSLGRLKSLLKRPPSLAKRSGVPERQLAQLSAWVQRADLAALQQQQQEEEVECEAAAAAAAPHVQLQAERGDGELPWGQAGGACSGAAAPATPGVGSGRRGAAAVPLSPLLQTPGLLLGHSMAAAAQVQQGSLAAVLPHGAEQAAAAAATAGAEGEALPSSSSTVSATAAALYQDQRFNLVCPCTISVIVTMRVQAAGPDVPPESLPAEASSRARAVAERQAKAAVDRSGRQRIEERLAEVVIRSLRAQRNRARHHQRDAAARQAQAQRALALARQATGRGASPAGQPEAPARAEPAAMLQMHSSPFALAATAAEGSDSAAPAAASSSATKTSLRRDRGGALGASNSGRALSSPAALPSTLLPGSRVTLDNLQGLLQPPRLDTSSSQGSGASEAVHGAAAPAPAGTPPAASDGRAAPQQVPSGRVNVADLAEVLGKQGKLE